jgi:hypothetical protein
MPYCYCYGYKGKEVDITNYLNLAEDLKSNISAELNIKEENK